MKYIRIISIFAVTLSVFQSHGQDKIDIKKIRDCYDGYKSAILKSDGEAAIKWVDQTTLDYYGKMLTLSISGDSATIQNLEFLDKLMVLMIRHRVVGDDVLKMDKRSIFIHAVNSAMVDKNSVKNLAIGDVAVTGNSAEAKILSQGKETPLYFLFDKEDGGWKLDITSIMGPTQEMLVQMIKQEGLEENDFIMEILKIGSGRPVEPTLWHPLKEE